MKESNQTQTTQWQAARYYLGVYSSIYKLHWLMPLAAFVAKILTWRIPAYLLAGMVTRIQLEQDINYVNTLLLAMAASIGGEIIVRTLWSFANRLQGRATEQIYNSALEKLGQNSMDFHNSRFAGSTATKASKLADGSEKFHDVLTENLPDFIATFAFAVFVIGREGLPAIGVLLLCFAGFWLAVTPLLNRRTRLQRTSDELDSARTGAFIDSITNISAAKSFGQEQYENKRFADNTEKARIAKINMWQFWNMQVGSATALFYTLIVFAPMFYIFSANSNISAGQAFLIFYVLDMLASRVWSLNNIWDKISDWLGKAAEGLDLVNHPLEVTDSTDAKTLDVRNGEVEFQAMRFSYADNRSASLYDDFTLAIVSGEKVGLVGPSGGGKTTLVKLLMRFMDVTGGSITIDGQNIAEVTQQSLRENISYIPQEPALFHRTIRENVAYGNLDASDEEIQAAAVKAHAHEFIKDLPDGYDTLVGERGVKLSGGQRQRVAIARAFLKDAPILVLDEATSALDSESEQLIQASLQDLMQGRTVVSIAHRLSTLQIMDRLVVVENGSIAEQGTHSELIAAQDTYARLWAHQSGDYIA